MFEENITGELLFNDPLILEKYLDDISHEVQTPYIQRRQENSSADTTRRNKRFL